MKSKLESIQVLRGLAALLVYFFHVNIFLPYFSFTDKLFWDGDIGVLMFFIVSGFIMVYTTSDSPASRFRNMTVFFFKRILRIVPLYYFATFLMMIIYHRFFALLTDDMVELIKTLLFIPLFTSNEGPAFGAPLLYVGWTLNYEMFFYFIFGLSLLFGRLRYAVLFTILLFLTVVLPLIHSGMIHINPVSSYGFSVDYLNFASNSILFYFIVGVVLGLILPGVKLSRPATIAFFLISSGLLVLHYFGKIVVISTSASDLLFVTLFVASVIMVSMHGSAIKLPRPFVYLGNISYSLYLIHPIVLHYTKGVFRKFGFEPFTHTYSFLILLTFLVVISSAISYELIEKKFTDVVRKRFVTYGFPVVTRQRIG